jgi:hypothetical protein
MIFLVGMTAQLGLQPNAKRFGNSIIATQRRAQRSANRRGSPAKCYPVESVTTFGSGGNRTCLLVP